MARTRAFYAGVFSSMAVGQAGSPPTRQSDAHVASPLSSVFMADCSLAAKGWPTFNTPTDLQNDSEWSSYFLEVYGEIPSDEHYPICVGAFTQIAGRGGQTPGVAQQCRSAKANDGDLVESMTDCCDAKVDANYIYNSRNLGHSVPANTWAEITHVTSSQSFGGVGWYNLAFGSAVWWNVGTTVVFNDHPDVSKALLGTECRDDGYHTPPATECEYDFDKWYSTARRAGYDSIQITNHYDCSCGEQGPSSWTGHDRLCHTEIIDLYALLYTHGGCSSVYRAGWAATQQCYCNEGLQHSNCKGFGAQPHVKTSTASPGPSPVSITPTNNPYLCLDVPGDDSSNGVPLWLWECNSMEAQRWVFDIPNSQIRFGADETKCIDAGDMSNGMQLFLWDCNGLPQQTWGYTDSIDPNPHRVYLADTSTCLDFYADWESNGQPLHVWECTGAGNQEWSIWEFDSQKSVSVISV